MLKNNFFLGIFLLNVLIFLTSIIKGYAQTEIDFNTVVATFKADQALKHSSWALYIKNADTKKELYSVNPELALSPASTQKVITTSVALELLGELYQYRTYLAYTGKIEEGVLKGNLIIKGSGDPSLESENFVTDKNENKTFEHILSALKKKGIDQIDGSIVADVNTFDNAITPNNWLWTDIGNYYGSGPSALSYKDNKVKVYFKSGSKQGDSTYIVKTVPTVDNLKYYNEVLTGVPGSGDNAYFYGAEFQNFRIVKGTIPPNKESFVVESSMPDAALYMVQELKKYFKLKNISVSGESVTSRILGTYGIVNKEPLVLIDSIVSPPLKDIIHFTNLKSVNLYAEHLLKTLSLIKTKTGNDIDGIRIIEQKMKDCSIDIGGMKLHDGSGLSPVNKLTVKQQCNLLCYMDDRPSFNTLLASLPIAGKTGSLSTMFKGTKAEGNLKAKSGYIGGVRAYTGYFTSVKGQRIAFSFIVNNYDCTSTEIKKKMELLMTAMVNAF